MVVSTYVEIKHMQYLSLTQNIIIYEYGKCEVTSTDPCIEYIHG